jgi:hypothetical protein
MSQQQFGAGKFSIEAGITKAVDVLSKLTGHSSKAEPLDTADLNQSSGVPSFREATFIPPPSPTPYSAPDTDTALTPLSRSSSTLPELPASFLEELETQKRKQDIESIMEDQVPFLFLTSGESFSFRDLEAQVQQATLLKDWDADGDVGGRNLWSKIGILKPLYEKSRDTNSVSRAKYEFLEEQDKELSRVFAVNISAENLYRPGSLSASVPPRSAFQDPMFSRPFQTPQQHYHPQQQQRRSNQQEDAYGSTAINPPQYDMGTSSGGIYAGGKHLNGSGEGGTGKSP